MNKTESRSNLLDTSIFERWHINLEVALYILLGVIAIAACFTNLGARTQSHDESLHALYSWKLYAGDGYEHNPMMHGPFLFHINALFYFLFGTSDFTARISTATFGVILVLLPALLRKELGRVGALVVSALTLISPSTLYHARYIRNDIYMMVWALLMAIALFRYMDSRHPKWLYLGGLAVTLSLCTKETAYITGFIGLTFVVILFAQQMFSQQISRALYIGCTVLLIALLVALLVLNASMPEDVTGESADKIKKTIEFLFLPVGILISLLLSWTLIKRDKRLNKPLTLVTAYVVAIATLAICCAAVGGFLWLLVAQLPEGILTPQVFLILQVVVAGLGASAGGYGWWILKGYARQRGWIPAEFSDKVMYITLAVVVIPFVLLYTTFFTNPKGLGSGTAGAITYWLAQQEVKRAGQPWFYYFIVAPLYEFLPIGFGLIAIVTYLVTGKVNHQHELDAQEDKEGTPLLPFVAYCVYWTLSAWVIYSWAGEKMPWMMVHVVQPMIVLTGRFVNDVVAGIDWRETWRKGGLVLALLVPIILLALGMVLFLPLFGQAFGGVSINDINDTGKWLFALVTGGALLFAAWKIRDRIGAAATWRVTFVSILLLFSLLTIRYAWMASYINYDTAKEFLVYAHSTPDVKQTVRELQEISRRLYGDERSIKFAYSSDATWPFEWYFDTNFPNRVFYGRDPSRESTDVPVLVVGNAEISATEPFLGTKYYRFDRKLIWWPHQDYYMNLSLAMPAEENRQANKNYFFLDMQDPEKRRQFLDVLFYRKYEQSLADWEPSHKFAFYVRKDIAAQLWDFGVAPAGAVDLGESEEAYEQRKTPMNVVSVFGMPGTESGQFNQPRNVAVGPDGSIYIADSGNNRIQKLSSDGRAITSWGHACKMYESLEGCQQPNGAGGFYDPWGIAVDADGFVYVADTWNHRIQKFTSDGEFVTMWGQYGTVDSANGGMDLLWGPRDIAIASDNTVYISDTGNKRILVYTANGEYVSQWGGRGINSGEFDEPVGIAISSAASADQERTYVVDTWNQRIQVFSGSEHFFTQSWEIDSWYGQSLENKPYVAVDPNGHVLATDPEGGRVLIFDSAGKFLTSLGQHESDGQSLLRPTGIAIDADGYIYVADPLSNWVFKLAPFAQ
ncbi:MAG: TIGR03663 family protein [Anaerolineae bacterium]|nr:TIGR03663 family protein [Anaerolineae bacterium]